MKKLIIQTAIIFLPLAVTSQTIISWEPEIIVSDGAVYGNVRPRITLNSEGYPVVVYGKSGPGTLHSSVWNGSAFSTPVPLLPASMSSYLSSWTGPDVASKGDTVIAVFKANPMETGHVYSVRSTDGGITYSDTIRVNTYSDGVTWLPSMDMDANGNPTVTFMMHDPSWMNPRYVVAPSNDQGLTYETEMDIAISIPEEACDCCPAEYVIKGNQEVLLFRNNDNNIRDIYAVYSDNSGLSFSDTENVDQLNWNITSCPSTGPHGVFNNDKLLSVYASRATGQYRVYISQTATTPSLAFENRTMMTAPTNVNGNQNYPRITGQNDTLVMVWQESETSNPEIFCSYTVAGNVTDLLANKEMVNSNTTGAQTNPDIVYKNGIAHLVYQDAATGSVIYRKGILGTADMAKLDKQEIILYPNPVIASEFFISKSTTRTIEEIKLTDALGKNVDFEIEDQITQIKISSKQLKEGIYFLSLNFSGDENKIIKLTIQ